MISNMTLSDELWDMQPPIISNPSRLFNLEPMGLGTAYVESLTSYVARLAEAHSVPHGTLLAIEVKPMLRHGYAINPLYSSSIVSLYGQNSVKALNGTQQGAKQLVQALEALTLRTDLQFLTLLPWAEVFPVLGLLKHFQAWCPYCYQEWLNNKQVIYSPLLWALKVVKICPYHHQYLKSQCPHCHSEFIPLWRNSRPGFCLKCGGWLGATFGSFALEKTLFEKTAQLQRDIWVAQILGELIAQNNQFLFPPPRQTIKTMLSAYVHKYSDGNVSAFGRWLGLSRYEILHWYSGSTIPNLDQLLRICYALETTLVKFLKLEVTSLSPNKLASLSTREQKIQPSLSKATSKYGKAPEQVIEAMQLALEEEPPPSLTDLALRLGFKSYSSLTTCSKSLSVAISAKYTDYQQQLRQERIESILTDVLASSEYPPPSLGRIARRTGIGLATFYRYCPILCHAISLRYEDYQKFHKKLAIGQGCCEVRRLAPELHAKGITPSVKNLRKFMQHPASLWQPEVVKVLSEVRRLLE